MYKGSIYDSIIGQSIIIFTYRSTAKDRGKLPSSKIDMSFVRCGKIGQDIIMKHSHHHMHGIVLIWTEENFGIKSKGFRLVREDVAYTVACHRTIEKCKARNFGKNSEQVN